ncbi:hypothetical protein [Nonomuraea sp. NPDC049784]|uniref:hypothetical protein n=1 Tax=Nonomuraea sp. NPDC049784 TaxID=3154361 RepID=UPI0033EDC00F
MFLSSISTRHGQALLSRQPSARCAFTAQKDEQTWDAITGIQGQGTCHRLEGTARDEARTVYAARFPFVADTPHLAQALSAADYWEVRPHWLRLIDNSRGFGHKTEWTRETIWGIRRDHLAARDFSRTVFDVQGH